MEVDEFLNIILDRARVEGDEQTFARSISRRRGAI
jgi:hypothetical protein